MNSVIDGRAKTARKILTNGHSSNGIGLVYREAMRRVKGQGTITVLDFGCGYGQSKALLEGVNDRLRWWGTDLVNRFPDDRDLDDCFLYQPWNTLVEKADMVLLSNVINVQETWAQLVEVLDKALSCVKYGGQLILNYPRSPRKLPCETMAMERLIRGKLAVERPDVQMVWVKP